MVRSSFRSTATILPLCPPTGGRFPQEQVLHLRAILGLRNTDQLAKLEADLQDRDSPLYHRWLTTDQFISRFGPTAQQIHAVAGWLTSQGLQVTASDIRERSVEFSGDRRDGGARVPNHAGR